MFYNLNNMTKTSPTNDGPVAMRFPSPSATPSQVRAYITHILVAN